MAGTAKFAISLIAKACLLAFSTQALSQDASINSEVDTISKQSEIIKHDTDTSGKKLNATDKATDKKSNAELETTADKNQFADIELIEVIGIRASLLKSLQNKRYAEEILDTVSAEDIGQFADENIAESLQRIAGVSLSRGDDGEGQSVQIRGESSNNIEINGQSILGSGESRSANFQDIPSEIFSTFEVIKASSADRIEGSLGGTINLKTKKPLEVAKNSITSVAIKAKYNELADNVSPEFNVFNSTKWLDTGIGDFGMLFTINLKEIQSHDEAFGSATWTGAPSRWTVYTGNSSAKPNSHWGALTNTPYADNLDPNQDGASDENDIFYVPNLWKTYSNDKLSKRASGNFSLQWQPTSKLNLWLDGTVIKVKDEVSNSFFSMQSNTGTGTGSPWADDNEYNSFILASGNNQFTHLNSTDVGDFYAMTTGRLGGMNIKMGSSPAVSEAERNTRQATLGMEYTLSDNISLNLELSNAESTAATESSQLLMSHDYNADGFVNLNDFAAVVDFNELDSDLGYVDYYDAPFDTNVFQEINPNDADFDRLAYSQLQRNAADTENTGNSAKFDIKYDYESEFFTSFQLGYRWAERGSNQVKYVAPSSGNPDGTYENGRLVLPYIADTLVNDEDNELSNTLSQCLQEESSNLDMFSGNLPTDWTATNCDAQFIEETFNLPNIRAINPYTNEAYYQRNSQKTTQVNITERTNAAYVKVNFFQEVFDMDWFGNFGVRYVKTDVYGTGWHYSNSVDEKSYTTYNVHSDYGHVLPSINSNLLLTKDLVLRMSWSKNLGRQNLNQIAPVTRLSYVDEIGEGYAGVGTAGNINLKPKDSENVDLSLEWYFNQDSMLAVALYYKEINNLTQLLPSQDLTVGDEVFLVKQWQNIGSTYINGYEVTWQQTFKFLPWIFKDTGINLNYTRPNQSEPLVDGHGEPLGKEGYSKDNLNMTLFYDNRSFSVRLAYAYRSEFVRNYQATLGYGRTNDPYHLPQVVEAYGQLDLSMNYRFTKKFKANLSIINLNEAHAQWYLKHPELTDRVAYTGRKANLSISYQF